MKKILTGGGTLIAVGAIIVACGGGSSESIEVTKGVILQNVNVVNTRDGSLTRGTTVLIDNGKIQKISSTAAFRASGTAQVVDGSGKFLVPGYLDMHTHAMTGVDLQPSYWPLMIANGITGIREMGGSASLIQRARQLNTDSTAGKVDAPEVLAIPSDIFQGQAPTTALATAFVKQQKTDGADFVKVAAGGREATLAILAEARNQGLGVVGHLTTGVSALESSNAGWKAIEHLGAGWGLLLGCTTEEDSIRTALLSGQGANPPFPATYVLNPRIYDGTVNAPFYQKILDTYSDAKCKDLAQAFAKNGTWQVPTMIRLRTQDFGDSQAYRTDPNLAYVNKSTRGLWELLGQAFTTTLPTTAVTTLSNFYAMQQKTLKMMKQSGVKMLAGSDLGGVWVIPGFSLHQEFRELAASGLTPLEILQMTTLNGAEFMNRTSTMGTVDEGKNADLVMLDANPVDDVANLSKISAVVLKGKYFSKSALDKLKSDVAAAYQ